MIGVFLMTLQFEGSSDNLKCMWKMTYVYHITMPSVYIMARLIQTIYSWGTVRKNKCNQITAVKWAKETGLYLHKACEKQVG